MPDHVLVQLRLAAGEATPAGAAARLGVGVGDLDAGYGVVPTDPDAGLYAVRLAKGRSAEAAARLAGGDPAEGVFADPPVSPFGPP